MQLENLIHVRKEEGCILGPTFGHRVGLVAMMREYNKIVHYFLRSFKKMIQASSPKKMMFRQATVYPICFGEQQRAGLVLPI
jgi:hypothetical protein